MCIYQSQKLSSVKMATLFSHISLMSHICPSAELPDFAVLQGYLTFVLLHGYLTFVLQSDVCPSAGLLELCPSAFT